MWKSVKNFFCESLNNVKHRLAQFINQLGLNWVVNLFRKRAEWIQSSIFNYSIFFFGGTLSLAIVRYFQIWITNSWDYMSLYYMGVTSSFCVSCFAVLSKYLAVNGYLDRKIENKKKWKAYEALVSQKHNLDPNFRIDALGLPLFFLTAFSFSFLLRVGGVAAGHFMLIISGLLICYVINRLYIYYYMIKTPIPQESFLTPSNFLVKAVGVWPLNRLFVREYSTRTRFQRAQALTTQSGKHFWPLLTSISALTVAALAIDDSMAFRNGETLLSTRAQDRYTRGWTTNSFKARERAIFLETEMGQDIKHCINPGGRLNNRKIHVLYNQHKANNFELPLDRALLDQDVIGDKLQKRESAELK